MPLDKTQDKVGTQRTVSSGPDGQKTGRGAGTMGQPKIGYNRKESVNQESGKETRPVPVETQDAVGTTKAKNASADGLKRNDGVGGPFDTIS